MTDLPRRTKADIDSSARMSKFESKIVQALLADENLTELEYLAVLVKMVHGEAQRQLKYEREKK